MPLLSGHYRKVSERAECSAEPGARKGLVSHWGAGGHWGGAVQGQVWATSWLLSVLLSLTNRAAWPGPASPLKGPIAGILSPVKTSFHNCHILVILTAPPPYPPHKLSGSRWEPQQGLLPATPALPRCPALFRRDHPSGPGPPAHLPLSELPPHTHSLPRWVDAACGTKPVGRQLSTLL